MAGTVKKLQHPEGTNVGAPTDLGIASSTIKISAFADDAAYVTAKGSPAADGDVYINTTSTIRTLRLYVNGAWRNAWIETDPADATKLIVKDLTGQTTGTTLTIISTATAHRSITLPDATTFLVGRATTDTGSNRLMNKELDDATVAFVDEGDTSKKVKFQVSGVTTATTRTLTVHDANTTILGHDTTQVVTNKDIDGGVAANTRRITVPADTLANLNSLSRKAGTIVYATDTMLLYLDNGTILLPVGGGSGGAEMVHTVTNADYTILDNDGYTTFLFSTGGSNRTVTLPTAADNTNRLFKFVKIDNGAGSLIIDGEGSETIAGELTQTIYFQNGECSIICDGTEFYFVTGIHEYGTYTPTGTAGTNTTTITPSVFTFHRNGKIVNVAGRTAFTRTGVGDASFELTLPIPSIFTISADCTGTSVIDAGGLDAAQITTVNDSKLFWFGQNSGSSGVINATLIAQYIIKT